MKPTPIDSLSRFGVVTSLVTSVMTACSLPQYITGTTDELGGATTAKPSTSEASGGESGKSSGGPEATTGGNSASQASSTSGSAGSGSGGTVATGTSAAGGNGSTIAGGGTGFTGGSDAGGKTAAGGTDFGGTGTTATGGTTTAGGTSSVASGGTAAAGRTAAGGTATAGGTSSVASGGTAAAGGGTAGATSTSTGGAATDPDLVLWYRFDDTEGPAVLDSSGHGRNGKLQTLGAGTAEYSTKHQVGTGALDLSANSATVGAYVDMPASLQAMGATSALTIATWVQLKANPTAWQRIFDFGVYGAETSYIFLTPMHNRSTPNAPRFAISKSAKENEQGINMTTPAALTTGVWHHFVVVLTAPTTYTGKLYIDNVAVGTNSAMTLHPSDLGATSDNWLGRSQYPGDSLFNGYLDDFRVYKRALTATEIATLYAVR
ncbi:MAG TPA: LamG domain-containing protein [Polyangiaceae bacterium]